MLRSFKPYAIEILAASVPARVIKTLPRETGLLIMAGRLLATPEDVAQTQKNGVLAVSTSLRKLWNDSKTGNEKK
ncbi:glycerol-3-phosphate responsive antiterminator [Thermosinus carboxydivorans]|uniref:glycerol-3-phosphate responsive antiterminator n=1 Tax=Thermosinus carboxydivorans TaxID=261685 RepID=UPI000682EB21